MRLLFFSENLPHLAFPSEDMLINMSMELTVFNHSLAIHEILTILSTRIPSMLASDMLITKDR